VQKIGGKHEMRRRIGENAATIGETAAASPFSHLSGENKQGCRRNAKYATQKREATMTQRENTENFSQSPHNTSANR
jgi:hypothetical protein